jgi:TorA maturation chaperone TorD
MIGDQQIVDWNPMTSTPKSKAAAEAFSKLAQIALARSNVFAKMAVAFFDPDADLVHALIRGSYLSELNGYYREFSTDHQAGLDGLAPLFALRESLAAADPAVLLKELKVEYARLFIGPSKPAVFIYETFYDNRIKRGSMPMLMVSPAALSVESAYRESGVEVTASLREPPDHFATEAEFLYYLCQRESDSWAAGENANAKKWRKRELAFLDGHMGCWGRQFCCRVESESQHPFYRAAAAFSGAFLEMEGSDSPENGCTPDPE